MGSEDTELEIWSANTWITGQHSVQKAPKKTTANRLEKDVVMY